MIKTLVKATGVGILGARLLTPTFLVVTRAAATILSAMILLTFGLGIAPLIGVSRTMSAKPGLDPSPPRPTPASLRSPP